MLMLRPASHSYVLCGTTSVLQAGFLSPQFKHLGCPQSLLPVVEHLAES